MKKPNPVFACLVGLSALFLLAACTDNGTGIFAGIETETALSESYIPDASSPTGVVLFGSNLYVAAGNIYTKPLEGSSNWTVFSPSQIYSGWHIKKQNGVKWYEDKSGNVINCSGIATDGTRLYLEFTVVEGNHDGDSRGLWTWTEGATAGTEILDASGTRINAQGLFAPIKAFATDPSAIFVQAGVPNSSGGFTSYSLYQVPSSGYALDSTATTPALAQSIVDVTTDGTTYWFATSSAVYESASAGSLAATFSPAPSSSTIEGIYAVRGTIYLSSRDDEIYRFTIGTSTAWANHGSYRQSGSNTLPNIHGMIAANSYSTAVPMLLVGSTTHGYFEMILPDDGAEPTLGYLKQPNASSPSTISDVTNYDTNVYNSVVRRFYCINNGTTTDVYAAGIPYSSTYGGLWKLTAATGKWDRE
jgi:hypothetical protein